METRKILHLYVSTDIVNIILDYAFKYEYQKELFELGYYEKCVELMNSIQKFYMGNPLILYLLEFMLKLSCENGYMSIVKVMLDKFELLNEYYKIIDMIKYDAVPEVKVDLSNNADITYEGIINLIKEVYLELDYLEFQINFKELKKYIPRYIVEENINLYMDLKSILTLPCLTGDIEALKTIINRIEQYRKDLQYSRLLNVVQKACMKGDIEIFQIISADTRFVSHP